MRLGMSRTNSCQYMILNGPSFIGDPPFHASRTLLALLSRDCRNVMGVTANLLAAAIVTAG